ncbi:YjbF family lipoprotein [Marinomonas sp. A79]|uniref:YjbF family lipoprotein n=1 Tax=Marinomonas vulgaris TaxID=2823372 RepID=A0ABS5HE48_9GAMM|nr:YjbF family lipoprotein [Marinomonas vulgaris]MBR7889304.1 YjbF family lipoprotein [Marinomonas vulgaris]
MTPVYFLTLKSHLCILLHRFRLATLALVSVFVLSGCANNSNNAINRFNNVLELSRGQAISTEHLQNLPFASALVNINDSNPVLMVLLFIDPIPNSDVPRLTWIAQDKATIVTENGRIVKTTGFPSTNIEGLIEASPSQRMVPALPSPRDAWQAMYDWSPGYRFGFTAIVDSVALGEEIVESVLWNQPAQKIQEHVKFDALNSHVINDFWVVAQTDALQAYVVKSTQYIGPKMTKIDMLMIKPFITEIKTQGIQ